MAAKYELKKTKSDQFVFNLKAANGEIILTSESYKTIEGALGGIESCKKNSADEARFETKTAKDGQTYFVLKAGNGQTIGKSEMYKTPAGCANGIASVKKNGPDARIVDTTAAG